MKKTIIKLLVFFLPAIVQAQNITIDNPWTFELSNAQHPTSTYTVNGNQIFWKCDQEPSHVYTNTIGYVYNDASVTKKVKAKIKYYKTISGGNEVHISTTIFPGSYDILANSAFVFQFTNQLPLTTYSNGMNIRVELIISNQLGIPLDTRSDNFNLWDHELTFGGLSIQNSTPLGYNRHKLCAADALTTNLNGLGTCVDNLTYKVETLSSNWQSVTGTYVPNTTVAYTGQSQINLSSTNFTPGKYRMTVSAAYNTQTITKTIEFEVEQSYSITSASNSYSVCENGSITISASATGNLTWHNLASGQVATGNSFTIQNAQMSDLGTYYINSDQLCEPPFYFTLHVNPKPQIDLSMNPTNICRDETPYQFQVAVNPSGGSGNWQSYTCATNSSGMFDPEANCNTSGWTNLYTFNGGVQYTASDPNTGCTATESLPSFTYDRFHAEIVDNGVACVGSNTPEVQLSLNTSNGTPTAYVWKDQNNIVVSTTSTLATSQAGTYYVTVYNTNLNCGATDEIIIASVPTIHSLSLSNLITPACQANSNINNSGSIDVGISNQYPQSSASEYTMTVSSTNTSYAGFTNTMSSIPQTVGSLRGQVVGATNNYTVSVEHDNGCIATQNFTVGADYRLDVSSYIEDATCIGKNDGEVTLIAVSNHPNVPNYSYLNNGPSGTFTGTSSIFSSVIQSQAATYSNAYVSVLDNGTPVCGTYTGPITVGYDYTSEDLYDINIVSSGASCLGVANAQLVATAWNAPTSPNSPTGGVFTYDWSNGVLNNQVNSNLLANNYAVTVTDGQSYSGLPNLNGCIISQSASIANNGTNGWQVHTDPIPVGSGPEPQTKITSMTMDDNDNVYVAGTFTGNMQLDGQTYYAGPIAINEFFVAAYSSCGDMIWAFYSQSENVTFDEVELDFDNGQLYVANLPSAGTGIVTSIENIGMPTSSFNATFQQDHLTLIIVDQQFNQSSLAYQPIQFSPNDILTDLEVQDDRYYLAGHFDKATSSQTSLDGYAKIIRLTPSLGQSAVWEDQNPGNIFNDLEIDNQSGDFFVAGKATSDVDVFAGSTSVSGGITTLSDAFVIKGNANAVSNIKFLKSSIEGEALGLEIVSSTQLAVVGNYQGGIYGFGGGTISSNSPLQMGFIANMSQSNLNFDWVKSLEGPATTPIANTTIDYATCEDVSVNDAGEVFVYGKFEGSTFELSATNGIHLANGNAPNQNIWNGKINGFTPSATNIGVDWLTSAYSPEVTPTEMVSGNYNNYIGGDFEDFLNVNSSTLAAQLGNPGNPLKSGYIVRFGDALDPVNGGYYKKDETEQTELTDAEVSLFPNPTSNEITITWTSQEEAISFAVLDIMGRVVFSSNNVNGSSGQTSFNVKDLNAGTYFIQLISDRLNTTESFIKQ